MKYENLKIEIISFSTSDVIATSAEVTTGAITMPWSDGNNPATAAFLPDNANSSNYNI